MSIQSVWIHARSRGHCGYDRCWSKDDMIVAGETEEEHDQSINFRKQAESSEASNSCRQRSTNDTRAH